MFSRALSKESFLSRIMGTLLWSVELNIECSANFGVSYFCLSGFSRASQQWKVSNFGKLAWKRLVGLTFWNETTTTLSLFGTLNKNKLENTNGLFEKVFKFNWPFILQIQARNCRRIRSHCGQSLAYWLDGRERQTWKSGLCS